MKKVMLVAPQDQREGLQCILGDRCTLLPCQAPGAAVELLAQHPDALILSLPLSGMDGLGFLEQNAPDLPRQILVLTTFLNEEMLAAFSRLNVDTVIRLPVSPDSLRKKLNDFCIKKRPS